MGQAVNRPVRRQADWPPGSFLARAPACWRQWRGVHAPTPGVSQLAAGRARRRRM